MSAIPNVQTKQKAIGISVLRLGETKGGAAKVYITNKKLQEVFPVGERVNVAYYKDKQTIHVTKADLLGGNHTISKKGNGTPVLDIKNQKVGETLGSGVEKIEVVFLKNEIVIKVSKTEKFKTIRAEKSGRDTFELFSGAGTLSQFFKDSGFNIRGGLELVDDYRALFHENNPGEEIYSIGGRLEDIHTSYFPKDIDVVLSGIPCTRYSGSNLKLKKAQKAKREGKEYDEAEIAKEYEAEALTFYVLTAIRAMNPKTVVVEEVVEYSESPASMMLRTVLGQMGYEISEAVDEGMHTKRKRWVLVANMGAEVCLDDLIQDDGKVINDFLETSIEDREWLSAEEHPRVRGMIEKGLGIRSCLPTDVKSNTFTTHATRHTEPVLRHPEKELYSEFTNREIANIHGLPSTFKLDSRKGISRQILGQGVTDMFASVANRILEANEKEQTGEFVFTVDTTSSRYLVANVRVESFCCTIDSQNKITLHTPFGDATNSYDAYCDIDGTGSACFIDEHIILNDKCYLVEEVNGVLMLGKEVAKESVQEETRYSMKHLNEMRQAS